MPVQAERLGVVRGDAFAAHIGVGEGVEGVGFAARQGLIEPVHRALRIARPADAVGVHYCQIGLCGGMAVDGAALEPLTCDVVVLRYVVAVEIGSADAGLRAGNFLRCRFEMEDSGARNVARHVFAEQQRLGHRVLRVFVAGLGQGFEQAQRQLAVADFKRCVTCAQAFVGALREDRTATQGEQKEEIFHRIVARIFVSG